jgi:hypothetical protein
VRAEKSLLDDVLGVVGQLRAEDREDQPHHAIPVARHQLVEQPQVIGFEIPPDQIGIAVVRSQAGPYSALSTPSQEARAA